MSHACSNLVLQLCMQGLHSVLSGPLSRRMVIQLEIHQIKGSKWIACASGVEHALPSIAETIANVSCT